MAITVMQNGRPITVYSRLDVGGEHIESDLITDIDEKVQQNVFNWIKNNLILTDTPNKEYTSYTLKNKLERETGIYIGNNSFKDAMLMCGFNPVDAQDANWCFCISKSSPAFQQFKRRGWK